MPDASPFWNAYKNFVKENILPGVPVPQEQEIFARSFSDPLTSATTALSSEHANYLVYGLANTTLATDGSKGAYDDDLKVYLATVDESTLSDPQAKKDYEAAEEELGEAKVRFSEVEKDARKRWERLPEPKPTFEAWASRDPIYTQAQRDLNLAQGARDRAYTRYHGRIDILRRYQEQVRKGLDDKTSYPSYNMAVEHESRSGFKPAYSASGLRDQLNRWIESANLNDRVMFEVKIDSGTPTSTQTSVDSGIYLKFVAKGVASFSLKAEQWNVPGVKTLYPKRVTGAPDVLNPKYALPVSVLVAYGPRLDVELRESSGNSTTLSSTSTTQIADDKPYIAVLGILGQHFPAK